MSKVGNVFISTTALLVVALAVVALAVGAAALSPLHVYRSPVYIVAGFAGVFAMTLLLFQPMLAAGYLPGCSGRRGRRIHQWVGSALVLLIIIHVAGLWITSPPDVIDALLFVSPTPFSVWGVLAMWAAFVAAFLAALRRKLSLRPRSFRWSHKTLVTVIVTGTVVHALLIEGAMEVYSKVLLSVLVVAATLFALFGFKIRSAVSKLRS